MGWSGRKEGESGRGVWGEPGKRGSLDPGQGELSAEAEGARLQGLPVIPWEEEKEERQAQVLSRVDRHAQSGSGRS